MMNFTWPSLKPAPNWDTTVWHVSAVMPGVTFAIRRVSLGERIRLTGRIREAMHKQEFLRAGHTDERTEAAMTELLLKAAYIEWGLAKLRGLKIDGRKPRGIRDVIERGPEALIQEITEAIQGELGLSEEERKN